MEQKKNINKLIEQCMKEEKIPELEEFLQIYSSLQNFLATTKGLSRKKFACFVEERFQKRKYKGNEEYDEYAAVAKDALTECFTKWGALETISLHIQLIKQLEESKKQTIAIEKACKLYRDEIMKQN